MALGLTLSLVNTGLNQAVRDASWNEYLTNSAGYRITLSNGQPVLLARPVGSTLLRNSRGQVITNSAGAAIYLKH